jgi:hypothetical protein
MIDDNLNNPDKQTGLINDVDNDNKPLVPAGAIEETTDQNKEKNVAPGGGKGVAGKLDEKDGDEFEGGNNTN